MYLPSGQHAGVFAACHNLEVATLLQDTHARHKGTLSFALQYRFTGVAFHICLESQSSLMQGRSSPCRVITVNTRKSVQGGVVKALHIHCERTALASKIIMCVHVPCSLDRVLSTCTRYAAVQFTWSPFHLNKTRADTCGSVHPEEKCIGWCQQCVHVQPCMGVQVTLLVFALLPCCLQEWAFHSRLPLLTARTHECRSILRGCKIMKG
ncbi:hypothetical protein COO60DRAFT_1492048 [Scenedesmus sp. NREL 46B-D3]|nr:hypothetical protein COO60DRAFT_1492048 [Scenedesmus sp. NREL 46B-D3]